MKRFSTSFSTGLGAFCLGATLLTGSPALAVDVIAFAETGATPDKLWAAIGDFCGIGTWHPAIAKCELSESNGDKLRKLTTKDGAVLIEKLVKLDTVGKSYTYQILESPLPVAKYESTIAVVASSKGSTVTWKGNFESKGVPDSESSKVIRGIYEAGLANLAKTQ